MSEYRYGRLPGGQYVINRVERINGKEVRFIIAEVSSAEDAEAQIAALKEAEKNV